MKSELKTKIRSKLIECVTSSLSTFYNHLESDNRLRDFNRNKVKRDDRSAEIDTLFQYLNDHCGNEAEIVLGDAHEKTFSSSTSASEPILDEPAVDPPPYKPLERLLEFLFSVMGTIVSAFFFGSLIWLIGELIDRDSIKVARDVAILSSLVAGLLQAIIIWQLNCSWNRLKIKSIMFAASLNFWLVCFCKWVDPFEDFWALFEL